MKKISQIAVINFPFFYTLERIVMKLMGFGLMLVPAFITRYLMDSRIEQGESNCRDSGDTLIQFLLHALSVPDVYEPAGIRLQQCDSA